MTRIKSRALACLGVAALCLLFAAHAAAAPTFSGGLQNGEATNNPQIPAFTITGALVVGWTLNGPKGLVASNTGPSPQTAGPFDLNLADDGVYILTANDINGFATTSFSLDTTPPATPSVTAGPPSPSGASQPLTFKWKSDLTAVGATWRLLEGGVPILEGQTPGASTTLTPVLSPGDHILQFRVAEHDSAGNQSSFSAPYTFLVDQTGPPAPVGITGPTGTTRGLTPSFTWQPTEGGGSFEWNVTDAAGASVLGPTVSRITAATSITTPALPLAPGLVHRLTFTVRQIDGSGNRGPLSAPFAFTITTVSATGNTPPTRLARFMHPSVGRVTTLRPFLTWRRTRPGTTIFNVQIWDGKRKVMTRWPTGTHLRVPAGKLKRGKTYSWYVWSWIGKNGKFYPRPLTSWFRTAR